MWEKHFGAGACVTGGKMKFSFEHVKLRLSKVSPAIIVPLSNLVRAGALHIECGDSRSPPGQQSPDLGAQVSTHPLRSRRGRHSAPFRAQHCGGCAVVPAWSCLGRCVCFLCMSSGSSLLGRGWGTVCLVQAPK